MTVKKLTSSSRTTKTSQAPARSKSAEVKSKAGEAKPKATGWAAKPATARPAARPQGARATQTTAPAAQRAPGGPTLSAAEKAEVARGQQGLAFLQSLWPVKVDANKPSDAYQLMQSLPPSVGD